MEGWQTQEGIIVWQGRHGDYGRVLHVLTVDEGIVHLYCRAGKKGGDFEELVRGEFVYRIKPGQQGGLKELRDWKLASRYSKIRASYALLECAAAIIRALRQMILPELPVPKLYALVCYFLEHLPHVEHPLLLRSSFYLRLLRHENLLQFPLTLIGLGEEQLMKWEVLALSPNLSLIQSIWLDPEEHSQIEHFFYEQLS